MHIRKPSANQTNYTSFWQQHSQLSFVGATKYLAHRDLPNILFEHLLHQANKDTFTILDYGCGNGETAQLVRDVFAAHECKTQLHCIDVNAKNLEAARARLPDANFALLEHGNFPNELKDVDLIICNFVLLENSLEEMMQILNNIQTMLAKNGIAIITHNTAKVYDSENKWVSFATDFPENCRSEVDPESKKLTRKDGQAVAKRMLTSAGHSTFIFHDHFYRRRTYLSAFAAAKLTVSASYKPLGLETDNIKWQSEQNVPPYRIDVLRHQPTEPERDNRCRINPNI